MGTMYGIIEQLCFERGIKPGKLCADLKISRGILCDLKAGRTQKLSAQNLAKVASYFGVTADYILEKSGYSYVELFPNAGGIDPASFRQKTEKAPAENGKRSVSDDDIKFALFGGDGEITDAMYDEVKRFAAYIKQREADKK